MVVLNGLKAHMEGAGTGSSDGDKREGKWQRPRSEENIFAEVQVMALLFKVVIQELKCF